MMENILFHHNTVILKVWAWPSSISINYSPVSNADSKVFLRFLHGKQSGIGWRCTKLEISDNVNFPIFLEFATVDRFIDMIAFPIFLPLFGRLVLYMYHIVSVLSV